MNGPETVHEITERARACRERNDWLGLLETIRVRNTPAPDRIAQKLGYLNRQAYIGAALKELRSNDALRMALLQDRVVPDPFGETAPSPHPDTGDSA